MQAGAGQTIDDALSGAFRAEARRGVELSIIGRAAAFALLEISYAIDSAGNFGNPGFQYRSALIAAALVAGAVHFFLSRRSARPVGLSFPFVACDLLIVGGLLFGWLPPFIADYPQFLAVRFQDVLLFGVVISLSVLPLSKALAAFAGAASAVVWTGGVLLSFIRTPLATTSGAATRGLTDPAQILTTVSRPLVLDPGYLAEQVLLLGLFTTLLVLAVGHGRRLVAFTAHAERDLDVLSRFFPPAVARQLSQAGGPTRLGVSTRAVAVLFADFDRQAIGAADMDRLEAFYAACEQAVFEHGGVIDRFVGDPVMATFGAIGEEAPNVAPALQAWRCARALQAAQAKAPFGLAGIGLNLGSAVCGEVGSERQRAFGVVGEAVNTARRMLDLAEGGAIVLTQAAVAALPGEEPGLTALGERAVKGLDHPVLVWSRAP